MNRPPLCFCTSPLAQRHCCRKLCTPAGPVQASFGSALFTKTRRACFPRSALAHTVCQDVEYRLGCSAQPAARDANHLRSNLVCLSACFICRAKTRVHHQRLVIGFLPSQEKSIERPRLAPAARALDSLRPGTQTNRQIKPSRAYFGDSQKRTNERSVTALGLLQYKE